MKWTVLILLLTQAGWASSCIFDRVEEIKGELYHGLDGNISACFAACYEDVKCIGIRHWDNMCHLHEAGNSSFKDGGDVNPTLVAYSLLRDDVDPMCQKFVNF